MYDKINFQINSQLAWMDRESSVGNLSTNLLPALSSLSFSGRTRHITLMLHSAGPSPIAHSSYEIKPYMKHKTSVAEYLSNIMTTINFTFKCKKIINNALFLNIPTLLWSCLNSSHPSPSMYSGVT